MASIYGTYINEGFIKDKWNKLNNKAAKKLIDQFIRKGDYKAARNCLEENKKYLSADEYAEYSKKIDNITPEVKERNDEESLNSIEKGFLNTAFNFINSEYNKLKRSPKYKDEKELFKYLYCEKKDNKIIHNNTLFIASVGFDADFELEYDDNIQLFELYNDFSSDLADEIDKKYKDIIDYFPDFNEGREYAYFVERKNIPGNK